MSRFGIATERADPRRDQERPAPTYAGDMSRAVSTMALVRWLAIPWALITVLTRQTVPYPRGFFGLALALVGVLAAGNLALSVALRGARTPVQVRRLGLAGIVFDLLIASGFVWLHTFDFQSALWAVLFILPLEGALLFGLAGSLVVWTGTAVLYAARELWGSAHYTYALDWNSIGFRMGIGFLIALVAGLMARDLGRQKMTLAEALIREQEANEKLERRSRFVQLLQRIAVAANEANGVDDAVRECIELVCVNTHWNIGHAYLSRDGIERRELVPTPIWYLARQRKYQPLLEATAGNAFPIGSGLPGKVLESGRPEWIVDIENDPSFLRAAAARASGIRSAFALPVLVGDKVAAVLEFFTEEVREPDLETVEALAHVGAQLGRVLEREQAGRDLRASEEQTRMILESATEAFVSMNRAGEVTEWNGTAENVFGWSREEALGRRLAELIIPPRHRAAHTNGMNRFVGTGVASILNKRIEMEALHKGGQEFPVELTVWAVKTGDEYRFNALVHDISERRRLEEELRRFALDDELTGLHNRRGFMMLGTQKLALIDRLRVPATMYFVDVNGMKRINDTLGHGQGDRALIDVATALRTTFRETDLIGRVGGDEFCVFAVRSPDSLGEEAIARLENAISKLNAGGERPYTLSISIGSTNNDVDSPPSIEALMEAADKSMYASKRLWHSLDP